jgi:hypothetical protein
MNTASNLTYLSIKNIIVIGLAFQGMKEKCWNLLFLEIYNGDFERRIYIKKEHYLCSRL